MITQLDKNTALVLIDLQYGIVNRYPANAVLKAAAMLVQEFHKCSLPVVAVNVEPKGVWMKSRKDSPSMSPPTLLLEFLKIVDEIKTKPEDIFITKHTWNAFFNTPLHKELQKRSVTNIVLCGIATSIGVEGTARAASELGYNISFATDAMVDLKIQAHQNSIENIFPRIGEVGTSQDIIKILKNNI